MPFRKNTTYSKHSTHASRSAHARGERLFRNYDTTAIQPKQSKAPVVVTAVVLIILVVVLAVFAFSGLRSAVLGEVDVIDSSQTATVVVPEGAGAQAIGKLLVEAHVVKSAGAFADVVRSMNAASSLKPGTYVIAGQTPISDIVAQLQRGPVVGKVLVREGVTLSQIADAVQESSKGSISAKDFLAAAGNIPRIASKFPLINDMKVQSLEGLLFPKTYPVTSDTTAEQLVDSMVKQFVDEFTTLNITLPRQRGLSAYDVVKLASIIEKESDEKHRPTVASVFYNRLAKHMKLQSDATVAYVVGHNPTPQDVKTPNPYNTYFIDGLTPTPICAPSLASLQAACEPEATPFLFFYFAKDAQGVMQYHFSETYEQHQKTYR